MRKTPQKWLSEFSADQLINELIRANSNKNNYEKLIFTGTRIIAILGTVLFLINLFFEYDQIPPLISIFVVSSLITALKNMSLDYYNSRAELKLQKMLNEVSVTFKKTLADFGDCFLSNGGSSLSECYLTFRAKSLGRRDLQSIQVNSIVKDILVKNNITILEYNNFSITLPIQQLESDASVSIK